MKKNCFYSDSLKTRGDDFKPKQKILSVSADGENGSPNNFRLPN